MAIHLPSLVPEVHEGSYDVLQELRSGADLGFSFGGGGPDFLRTKNDKKGTKIFKIGTKLGQLWIFTREYVTKMIEDLIYSTIQRGLRPP